MAHETVSILKSRHTGRILLARGGIEQINHFGTLARRLQAVPGGEGRRLEKVVFRGEHHMSVVPAAISRAMTFALSRIDPYPDVED
jgi:hypothetical protein